METLIAGLGHAQDVGWLVFCVMLALRVLTLPWRRR